VYTLAEAVYLDSSFDVTEELPRAGSALENPYVFDASARELKAMAAKGLIEIVAEHTINVADECLIDRLCFRRVH
jgi:hypothetical protein